MKSKTNAKYILLIVVISIVLFPFFLNWALGMKAFVSVVGDSTTWLSFWPVYLSAIASFGMIFFTYLSLKQNKKQIEELQRQREEEERARIVFSVVVYQFAFMLKISNIGKRNVYNAVINFNEDFLSELLQERFQEGYRQLSKPFFVEAGTSRYLYIGFCQDINDAWKNKNVVIRMKGSYNDVYTINEEIEMNMFLDKTFMLVKSEEATILEQIKKGLVVQSDSHKPVQVSLETIAGSLQKVEKALDELLDYFRKEEEIDEGYSESRANEEQLETDSEKTEGGGKK